MRNMLLALLFLLSIPALAQQVGPITQEFKARPGKAIHGSFQVHNVGTQPLVVTVEPMSFDRHDGRIRLLPLLSTISLKLSTTSFRLAPQEDRPIFFSAACQTLPCYFQLFATMTGGPHRDEGLQVALHIPSVVYVCDKQDKAQKNCREYVRTEIFKEQAAASSGARLAH